MAPGKVISTPEAAALGALTHTSAAALLHGLPACAYVVDLVDLAGPRLVYANRAALLLFGYDPASFPSAAQEPAPNGVHPDDRPRLAEQWGAQRNWDQGDASYSIRVLDVHGQWRRLACRENVLRRNAAGVPTHLLGVATEITAANEAHDALMRERETTALQQSNITQKLSEMSYLQGLVDAQQEIGTAPLEPLKLMAITQERILKDTPYQSSSIVSYNAADGSMTVLSAAGDNAPPVGISFAAKNSFMGRCLLDEQPAMTADVLNEADVDAALSMRLQSRSLIAAPIYLNGQVWGAIGAWHASPGIRNPVHKKTLQLLSSLLGAALVRAQESKARQDTIAALHLSEERLRDAHQAAQRIAESRSAFLSNMSHEIRTPLNGVVGMLDLLHRTVLSDEQLKYTRVMRAASEGLMTVINDILDLAKIESGSLELSHSTLHLTSLLEDCISLVEGRARDKGVRLILSVDAAVPVALLGDAARVRQVLLNLLSNAVKFTDQGEITIKVHVGTQGTAPGPHVFFQVSDTGTGIARDKLMRLFKPFAQVHGANTQRGGTGLGLAISKQLVELMGGHIGAESAQGLGSVFWFSLPAVNGDLHAAPLPKVHAVQEIKARVGHVLVADDNSVNLLVATTMLHKLGCTTDTVNNGKEAVEAVLRRAYDLVLMDCQMPELDGFAATRVIRENETRSPRRVPIVALTANVLQDDQDQCRAAGMDDHLAKPLRLDALRAALAKWLPAESAATP